MNTSSTPIWLDMRTEYIDANFGKFLEYLYSNKGKASDIFYRTSMDLLRKRVDEIISQISSEPLSAQDSLLQEGEDQFELWIQLLGAYILSEDDRKKSVRAFVFQILLLIRVCPPERTEALSEMALSLLVNDERFTVGYTWNDILQFFPDVLANKIINYAKCGQRNTGEKWFEGNGCARLNDGTLQIMNLKEKDSAGKQVESLRLAENRIAVMSAPGEKLKQSLQNDISALSSFTRDYIGSMVPVNLRLGEKKLRKYYPDEEKRVDVRITEVSYNAIHAVTIDKEYYPVHGQIHLTNTLYFSLLDLIKCWKVGDELPCRITKINADGSGVFDITAELVSYVVEDYVQSGYTAKGMVTKVINGQHTMWLSDLGVPLYTQFEQYDPGTVATLRVTEVCSNGYIKCVMENEENTTFFDPNPSKKELLEHYCYDEKSGTDTLAVSEINRIDHADIRAMMTCLYLQQRQETQPIERFRLLCAIQIMCKLVDDTVSAEFVHFMTQYLGNIMYFAKGQYEDMSIPKVCEQIKDDSAVIRRLKILEVLCCYGHDDSDEILENAVEEPDETINHLAKVIQSCNRLHGVLSEPMRNAIMHEILKMLRVEDYAETDLEDEGGVYLGIENGHQEFKTSFIFPPDNQMQPMPSVQKMNVFKAVCAFLNTESGGMVYLGVNDLGTITGVDNDLNYLKKTLDGYMRYITDEAKKEFGLGVLTFIDIQPMYDERVVAISVKPCDYKVVELAGKAYIRTNAESREMTKPVRLRIEERRRTYDLHHAESVSSLQTAIANQRQVIVHGYSSSHGGDRRDRHLEPFAFTHEKKHVWCFDLDDRKVKLFSVARISNVEILDKEWTASQNHKEGNLDVFYMTGDVPIKISLELDRMAYNLMIEEYPESKRYMEDTHKDSWILNTDVYNILGIGRFYIGLADHITILDAPDLYNYAKEYFEKHSK